LLSDQQQKEDKLFLQKISIASLLFHKISREFQMSTRIRIPSFLAGLGLFLLTAASHAATISCTGADYDISTKVSGATNCLILSPLNGETNDNVDPPPSSYTVNQESFFGINNWAFDGKYENSIDGSQFFTFTGDGQSGTYSLDNLVQSLQFMFVMKDGSGTNLVAYLLPLSASSGTYDSPFTTPPFSFTGDTASKDISHISVYYVSDPGGPGNSVPEPGTTAILGLGLLGIGFIARRKSGRQA
jgi:hypothetical protein